MFIIVLFIHFVLVSAGPATESYKNQYCTDPRTTTKHAAYTEWADAYSCTRHRCQPGGRNLAIYSVGCKRVEAPESAIECEEVVEDTNMQFPYCCTRLRCLVVVRGEVWTRVLGQPWENLPAAPWSHMYKMKRPPPMDEHAGHKNIGPGPIYELQDAENEPHDKVLRASKSTSAPDYNEAVSQSVPSPDIVIALATTNDEKEKKNENIKHKRARKNPLNSNNEEETDKEHNEVDFEETKVAEKAQETSDEKLPAVTPKLIAENTWTHIPQNQWKEHEPSTDLEYSPPADEKKERPSGLQALVDAIGNRMRDIESVVQKMSEKVHKESDFEEKQEIQPEIEALKKRHKNDKSHETDYFKRPKKSNPQNDNYKRFSPENRGSKYLHPDVTEKSLYGEDNNMKGYFSDASNVFKRTNLPKVTALTYVAPVENHRKSVASDVSDEKEKKHKKHSHKKKRKGKGHKKHVKNEKRKHFNKLSSKELDKNVISLEDSSAVVAK
ncbi:unnamed protein product, partial [Brenthis ino]